MDNIQIKRKIVSKRNMQSLIEDSAIDYDENGSQQMYDIKKAYNQSIKQLGSQNNRLIVELQKLKIINKRNQQNKQAVEQKLKTLEMEYQKKCHDLNIFKKKYQHVKRKMQGLDYKITQIQQNRQAAQIVLLSPKKQSNQPQQDIKQIYKDIGDTLKIKIKQFSQELKSYPMSQSLQWKIQSFLQELLYINPHSARLINSKRNKNIGYITNRNPANSPKKFQQEAQSGNEPNEWKQFQNSLEKLRNVQYTPSRSKTPKQINRNTSPIIYRNIIETSPMIQRSKSRRKIFDHLTQPK